ncbi:MAG: geranylgeranylglyceryl/heptaprenylglyceryl phosphate synthase [Ignavibacteriales bacterium]
MKVYEQIQNTIIKKGAAYFILIDPDKTFGERLEKFIDVCVKADVDGFLIGGSLMLNPNLSTEIEIIKKRCSLPVIIFPGSVSQLSPNADALLYISLISGRNADQIIGKHILAAPMIKKTGIEPISTGYILVESGSTTTAEYISGSKPIPRNKPEIAMATALAAEFMGMKMIYLEAGSGAKMSVPEEMIKLVSSNCSIPVIVGGGICDSKSARAKVNAGAKIIVTGNHFENESKWSEVKEFSDAIHFAKSWEI